MSCASAGGTPASRAAQVTEPFCVRELAARERRAVQAPPAFAVHALEHQSPERGRTQRESRVGVAHHDSRGAQFGQPLVVRAGRHREQLLLDGRPADHGQQFRRGTRLGGQQSETGHERGFEARGHRDPREGGRVDRDAFVDLDQRAGLGGGPEQLHQQAGLARAALEQEVEQVAGRGLVQPHRNQALDLRRRQRLERQPLGVAGLEQHAIVVVDAAVGAAERGATNTSSRAGWNRPWN